MHSNLMKISGLLAILSSAVAVPVVPTGTAPAFYDAGNSTDGYYGLSGSGFPTATGARRQRKQRVTSTTTATVHYVSAPAGAPAWTALIAAAAAPGDDTTTSCTTQTITSTFINRVTVTVTPAAAQAPSAVSEENEAVGTLSAEGYRRNPTPVAAPSYANAPQASSYANAPAASSSVVEEPRSAAPAPSAAATSTPPSSSGYGSTSSGHKRGLAYNDAGLTTCFEGKLVSWAYNWGSKSSGLGSAFEFVPMLWSNQPQKTSVWEKDAKAAIANGATALLAFNEPDHSEQASMSPADCARDYRTYFHDMFGGAGVKLGSPAVTNGGGSMGLTYLKNFMDACSGCKIDFVNIHWYDSATNIEYFKNHVKQAHEQSGKPLWITEFGAFGTDEQVNTFLKDILPWLDSQSYVERYSYFMAREGLLNKGSGMSLYGNTFATFTG